MTREQCFCAGICVMGIKIHTRVTPERTSSSDIRLCPSRRSSYRSVMCFLTLGTRRQEGEGGKKRKRKLIPTPIIPLLTQHCWHLSDRSPHSRRVRWQRLLRRQRRSTSCVASCPRCHDTASRMTLLDGGERVGMSLGGDCCWHGDSAAGSASVLLWFESGTHDGADE